MEISVKEIIVKMPESELELKLIKIIMAGIII
jgi:hypothetical protein